MRVKASVAGLVMLGIGVFLPASQASADTTNPSACVGQSIHTIAIPSDGNVAAHAAAHGLTVQQLLEFIRDVHCAG